MNAHQRNGELEAKLVQRDLAIRELRRRLHDLEQPFWERQSKLETDLAATRQRAAELELSLQKATESAKELAVVERQDDRADQLQAEIAAIRATRTFRYTADARAVYTKIRRIGRRQQRD